MSITITELDDQVRDGAALLDERIIGWRDLVDVPRLDVGSACRCILGQVFGDFYDGVHELGISYRSAIRLGFETNSNDEYAALNDAWRRELA
jgi:hypothetical protein